MTTKHYAKIASGQIFRVKHPVPVGDYVCVFGAWTTVTESWSESVTEPLPPTSCAPGQGTLDFTLEAGDAGLADLKG